MDETPMRFRRMTDLIVRGANGWWGWWLIVVRMSRQRLQCLFSRSGSRSTDPQLY